MTTVEKHIQHFNRLSGNLVTKKKLQDFYNEVVKVKSPALAEIEERLLKVINRMGSEPVMITLKEIAQPTESKKVKSKRILLVDDDSMLHGLELIQNDKHLSGKQLGQVGETTYKVITDKILSLISKEGLIWRKPWNENHQGKESHAQNYITKNFYRGTNYYLNYLLLSDYQSPYFMTFNQVDQKGGKVKAGQKGWPVIYFKYLYKNIKANKLVDEKEAVADGKLKAGYSRFPALFYYNVFNSEQCEGLNIKPYKPVKISLKEKIESCEAIVKKMPKKPSIENVRGDRAFYRPSTDSITMPLMEQFTVDQEYYSTLFHEMVHSTGSPKRLARDLSGRFGDKKYAFEELIAELGVSYLCGESGILYFTMKNTAAYLKSWTKKLREEMHRDPKFFLRAAAAAEKASEFILGRLKDTTVEKSSQSTRENKKSRPPAKRKASNQVTMKISKKAGDKTGTEDKNHSGPATARKRPQGVYGANDIASRKIKSIDLDGRYKDDFTELNGDTQILIWGPPGGGKTSYLLYLAEYLAKKNLKVLYVAHEEFRRTTFTKKINELKIKEHANLDFVPKLPANVQHYDAIFLDSVNSQGLKLKDYIAFAEKNPDKIIIPIVQSTKEGDFRGGKDWEHEVDIAGEIRNRKIILRKNRLDPDFYEKSERMWLDEEVTKKHKGEMIRKTVRQKLSEKDGSEPKPTGNKTIITI